MITKKEINEALNQTKDIFNYYDDICFMNSEKVLNAFHKYNVSYSDFEGTTGYGYSDIGRDKIERIYSEIFGGEDAIVRKEIVSGTHAIYIMLSGIIKQKDKLLVISGTPYDTIHESIGIKENKNSLISNGIIYEEIDLLSNDFDYEKIKLSIEKELPKVIYIQRSIGYSLRESIDILKMEQIVKFIKNINKNIIIAVDNCYTEFVESKSPLEVGCDLIVGSLIKNLGAGIVPSGGYIIGRKDLINDISERLYVPGLGKEIGPSLNMNKYILQGLYNAPSVVNNSLKTVIIASLLLENNGFKVEPKYNEKRSDIVEKIYLENADNLIKFVNSIQKYSAIDSNFKIIPDDMPGYDSKIVMASGSFITGSSIELSCDAPLRAPFVAYLQGSITFEYGLIAIMNAINELKK